MKYPFLQELSVFELATLQKEAQECNDKEFRDAILLEFRNRSKEN